MAKTKEYELRSRTDIKVFLLFILDAIHNPVDYTTLRRILYENTAALSTEYDECLDELVDGGHIYSDTVEGERYFMLSESGRRLSAELYDTLDPAFRERSLRSAMKHLSLSDSGVSVSSVVTKTENARYAVHLVVTDKFGEIMNLTLTVNALSEADKIIASFSSSPAAVYRGVRFAATGRLGYLA